MADIDPTRSTSRELGRKPFLGLSTAAVAAASTIARALAADQQLGKPHPPLVPENDPAITIERPMLEAVNGQLDAYAALPRDNTVRTPGVVVVQHIWGVDAQIRDTVRRLAKAGFVTVAPDLFAGLGAPNGDNATDYAPFAAAAAKLVDATVDDQIRAAAVWIRSRAGQGPTQRPPKVGVTGFCMGGSIALRAAIDDAHVLDAAVIFYGKVRWGESDDGPITQMALSYTDEFNLPIMGQYGARDTSIKVADVRAMQARLRVPHDIKIYDEAGHAFFDDTRARYVASAAEDSWKRTLTWFNTYLR
jgi:carboxymethylenebutenolidase